MSYTDIDWTRALQLVGLIAATHMGGYGLSSDVLACHNLLTLRDRDTVVRHWYRAWDFGRKYGPYMTLGPSILHGFLAWKGGRDNPAFTFNVAASVFLGLIGPHSFILIFPYNDKMLAEYERLRKQKKTGDEIRGATYEDVASWAAEWKRLDAQRTILAHLGALCGLLVAYRS